jgi:hypothetical protein
MAKLTKAILTKKILERTGLSRRKAQRGLKEGSGEHQDCPSIRQRGPVSWYWLAGGGRTAEEKSDPEEHEGALSSERRRAT